MDEIKIEIKDKDILIDDVIGEISLKTYHILDKCGQNRWLTFYHHGLKAAEVMLDSIVVRNRAL